MRKLRHRWFPGRLGGAGIGVALGALACRLQANPVGGTATRGTATFTTQGPKLTIHTSDRAQINWSSFNIGVGETTTFVQPSASSVVWNQINDRNPSQILGHLNANGYVVLQNASGFYIGGQAVISTHGLVMTTSPTPAPDFATSGAWDFKAPPPTAAIINYGQIRQPEGDRGGAAYLIAADIQNYGSISAPQGDIGLFAGKEVLLSSRPDGRGLSARVTLPQGSVNNQGQLIADAGTIAVHAQVVNQGGLIQANSVRTANGVVELVAGDRLTLGDTSIISAQGDASSAAPSPGGFVVLNHRPETLFSDAQGSKINVAGQAGGRDGLVEVFGDGVDATALLSSINERPASQFLAANGLLLLNPLDLTLSTGASQPVGASPNLNVNDLASFSKINLVAANNLSLKSGTTFVLSDSADSAARLSLTAGNNITLANGSAIIGGLNWNVAMSAGPLGLTERPELGGGIYCNGNAYLQTQNGSIDLWAANEVIVNPGPAYDRGSGAVGNNGVRTRQGGSISVTAQFGDIITGGNYNGFLFDQTAAPYYRVSPNAGGISTIAGGDVTLTAGGDITSYLPVQDDYARAKYDGGTGAFGPQAGNVTITAGGNVSGHYVLANGLGTIRAGGDVGAPTASGGFALSLIKGFWDVAAPHGDLYVQDVRNPNGILNDNSSLGGYHRFNYDPAAGVSLQAGNRVEITGAGAPHLVSSGDFIPLLFPPTLRVSAGAGGFVLNSDVTLFPSPLGELRIVTTDHGNFESYQDPETPDVVNAFTLAMSDSGATQWRPPSEVEVAVFGPKDHAATPPELNNPNAVEVHVAGDVNNVVLHTAKRTTMTVAGDGWNFGFLGQNLHSADVTSVNVTGDIAYSPSFAFTQLSSPLPSANSTFSAYWDSLFSLLLDPTVSLEVTPEVLSMTPRQQTAYAFAHLRLTLRDSYQLQAGYDPNANPGFIYDAASGKLGYRYQMSQGVFNALNRASIPILKLDPAGNVLLERGADGKAYFATTTASFIPLAQLQALHQRSQLSVKNEQSLSPGFQIGGPGQFNIAAHSLDLGSSSGIISWGIGADFNPVDYSFLAPWTTEGAAVNVHAGGDLRLLTSTIASVFGGDISVTSGGGVYLSLGDFSFIPPGANICYGIFTSGFSDVSVVADGDVNVGGARIATFNGGNVVVRSEHGSVNAGNGANALLVVPVIRRDGENGPFISDQILAPRPFGSGIMALSPAELYLAPGATKQPGNITIETPNGDIVSTLGGIQQFALNGDISGGPTITLRAGTVGGYAGNVDLGQGGVVGGTVNIDAQGSIKGLIVSRQNANINAAQSFSGTLLAGGTANVSATAGSVSGTVIGIGGVNASGGGGVSASVMSQNASIGGATAQSTLGNSAAASTASQAAAQQASSDAKEQYAKDTTKEDDDNKKKKTKPPVLTRRVGRVTVILPGG